MRPDSRTGRLSEGWSHQEQPCGWKKLFLRPDNSSETLRVNSSAYSYYDGKVTVLKTHQVNADKIRVFLWLQDKFSAASVCVCVCRQVGSLLKLTLVNLSFQATISCRHGFWGHYCCFSTKKSLKKPRFPQVTKTQKAFGCSDVNGEGKGWPFLLTANSWEWWPLCVRCIRHVPPWKPVQSAFWENLTRKWAKPHWISERKGSWPPHARLTIGLFLCLQSVCAIDFFKKKKSLERAE